MFLIGATIRRIAQFIGIPLDDELYEIVLHQSSLEFMKTYERHFDDHLVPQARNAVLGLPPDSGSTKVRKGLVGEHRHELSDEILAEMDFIWQETFGAKYGYQSYDALRTTIINLA